MEITFNEFWEDLNNGFEFTYLYLDNSYSISKLAKNAYIQKILVKQEKKDVPCQTIITLKTLKEMFPNMQDIQYNVNAN